MPSTPSELTSWARAKARNKRREMLARAEVGDPEALAWLNKKKAPRPLAQKRRKAAREKEKRRKQALKDADLFYYYRPEIFIVVI